MNLARLIVGASLACLLCGCGTLNNSVAIFYHQPPADPPADYRPPDYVYGGVKSDVAEIRSSFSNDNLPLIDRILSPLLIADIPLSAVCDTLNLKKTIEATQKEADWWREVQETRRTNRDVENDEPSANPRGRPSLH